jgi:hypothetical protein
MLSYRQIIKKIFQPYVKDAPFPPQLVPDLLKRFSSKEGYRLYPEVLPFFEKLREIRRTPDHDRSRWPWRRTVVGIVTNSDDRVPGILESFGLEIGPRFDPEDDEWEPEPAGVCDIDFVVLSYDVGAEKPHTDIFRARGRSKATPCCTWATTATRMQSERWMPPGRLSLWTGRATK